MVNRLVILSMVIFLGGCTAVDLFNLLTKPASNGISAEAQIGDRENAIESNDTTIKAEDSTVSVDNRESSFQGEAKDVDVNNADHIGYMLLFAMGSLFGIAVGLLLPQYKLIFERKS